MGQDGEVEIDKDRYYNYLTFELLVNGRSEAVNAISSRSITALVAGSSEDENPEDVANVTGLVGTNNKYVHLFIYQNDTFEDSIYSTYQVN